MISSPLADPECENKQSSPKAILLSPLCQKKRITLVCLAQGFPYQWPLNVTWKRDGQEIRHQFSFATEPVQEEGKCNFATASRLSVLAEEWQDGHNYSCHVRQIGLDEKYDWVISKPGQKTAASGISEVQLSLSAGHFIFLLLVAKSLAYSVVLSIYRVYRKRGL